MEIVLICSIIFIILLVIKIYQLLQKIEQFEDYTKELEESNLSYVKWFDTFSNRINESYSHIRNIDRLGSFEADDETGRIYKALKSIIEDLKKVI